MGEEEPSATMLFAEQNKAFGDEVIPRIVTMAGSEDEMYIGPFTVDYHISKGVKFILRVFLTEDTKEKKDYTILKRFNLKETYKNPDPLAVQQEVRLTIDMKHPHIVEGINCYYVHNEPWLRYLQMEYLEGAAMFISSKYTGAEKGKERYETNIATMAIAQVLTALLYLKEHSVAHRDIKPDNIFIATLTEISIVVKLGDFGISKKVEGEALEGDGHGTEGFNDPANFTGAVYNPFAADVFSLGITFFVLLTGQLPMDPNKEKIGDYLRRKGQLNDIRRGRVVQAFKYVFASSPEFKAINIMSTLDPSGRPTVEKLLEMEFFSKHLQPEAVNDTL